MKQILFFLLCLLFQVCSIQAIELTDKSEILGSWEELAAYSQKNEWPNLSRNRAIAIRTQRDVSENVTIEYSIAPGVDLSTVVFDPYGYNPGSLDTFRVLTNVGVQSFLLNLYYDETNKNWLMCSKEKIIEQVNTDNYTECNVSNFNITSFIATLNQFLVETNNDLNINLMFLLIKLNSFTVSPNELIPSNLTDSGIMSLSSIFSTIVKVVSPLDVDNNELPTLHNLLFKLSKRVFPVIIEDNLPSNTTYSLADDKYTFFTSKDSKTSASVSLNVLDMEIESEDDMECQTLETVYNSSSLHFAYDSEDVPFTIQSYWESIQCGYSPIINHAFSNISDFSTFLEVSLWSWSPYQPTVTATDELSISSLFSNLSNRGMPDYIINSEFSNTTNLPHIMENTSSTNTGNANGENNDDNDYDEYDNRCAVLSRLGWIATSCERKLRAFCVSSTNSSDFAITSDKNTYAKANMDCKSLDEKYELAVPRNALQQEYMMSIIPAGENVLWINLNSLSSKNCWVVGIDTNCPYQAVVSHHIFIQMITPSSVMGILLVIIFLAMQFQQLPVYSNRKYWRKLLNEKLKNDYDGVPS